MAGAELLVVTHWPASLPAGVQHAHMHDVVSICIMAVWNTVITDLWQTCIYTVTAHTNSVRLHR